MVAVTLNANHQYIGMYVFQQPISGLKWIQVFQSQSGSLKNRIPVKHIHILSILFQPIKNLLITESDRQKVMYTLLGKAVEELGSCVLHMNYRSN